MGRVLVAAIVITLAACAHSSGSPSAPSPTSVDVLDYVVGDQKLWPRGGSFYQNQSVDLARQQVCWVKYGNPQRFECWTWDDHYVYHQVDHALDGDSSESYHFTDGRWMPRFIDPSGGDWVLDVANNTIVWFDAGCGVNPSRSGVFPYRQRVSLAGARDAGADIGVRDTLVLEYQPYDLTGKPGPAERFYFARGAGWYEWDRDAAHVVFNRVGGPIILPDRGSICGGPSAD